MRSGDNHPVIVALDCAEVEERRRHEATMAGIAELREHASALFADDSDSPPAPAVSNVKRRRRGRGKAQSGEPSEREVLGVLKGLDPGEKISARELTDRTGYSEGTVRGALAELEARGEAHASKGESHRGGNGPPPKLWAAEPDPLPSPGPTSNGSSAHKNGSTAPRPTASSNGAKRPAGNGNGAHKPPPDTSNPSPDDRPLDERIYETLVGRRLGLVGIANIVREPSDRVADELARMSEAAEVGFDGSMYFLQVD